MANAPTKRRRFFIPFTTEETPHVSLLMLDASTYSDALAIAKCICGPKIAEKSLCYKDFTIYD